MDQIVQWEFPLSWYLHEHRSRTNLSIQPRLVSYFLMLERFKVVFKRFKVEFSRLLFFIWLFLDPKIYLLFLATIWWSLLKYGRHRMKLIEIIECHGIEKWLSINLLELWSNLCWFGEVELSPMRSHKSSNKLAPSWTPLQWLMLQWTLIMNYRWSKWPANNSSVA